MRDALFYFGGAICSLWALFYVINLTGGWQAINSSWWGVPLMVTGFFAVIGGAFGTMFLSHRIWPPR